MKRPFPWEDQVDVSALALDSTGFNSSDVLIRRAAMYQDYMKQIPIPSSRGSVIPFLSWTGLGKSIKQLYGQPLHYLTNILLKQWDQLRIGSDDEYKPLDDIIHPCKAEATIWLIEEIHRQTSSHFHIADLWKMDPIYSGAERRFCPRFRVSHFSSLRFNPGQEQVYSAELPEILRPRKLNVCPHVFRQKLVINFHDYPDIAMDKQIWKKRSGEARLKRKMILNEKRPSRFRISPESAKMPHHTNDANHLSRPATFVETNRHSMTVPMSYFSKEQETLFFNRNRSTAMFGRSLISGRPIIGENHHVSPRESDIHSTTHLEEVEVEGNHLSRPATYIETSRHSMTTPLSYHSKEQETSFINRNKSPVIFGRSLISSRHIIGENDHVSPGELEIRSTTHLEEVEEGLSENVNTKNIGVLNTERGVCSAIAMKRPFQSSLHSSSPNSTSKGLLANPIPNLPTTHIPIQIPSIDIDSSDVLIRRAAMYQDYMEQIPIPSSRGSVIPFTSWMGLGISIKKLYGQPLHYLTNIILKQWDQMRIGSDDEYKRLDDIIHPYKAETTVWLMEQIHRQSSSHVHLANLWKMDPMYNSFVDSIFPTLQHTS